MKPSAAVIGGPTARVGVADVAVGVDGSVSLAAGDTVGMPVDAAGVCSAAPSGLDGDGAVGPAHPARTTPTAAAMSGPARRAQDAFIVEDPSAH
jgi:hypothetical protein